MLPPNRSSHHLKLFLWCKNLEIIDKASLGKGVLHIHCLGAEEREEEKEEHLLLEARWWFAA